jgi:hypothetical protein
MYQVKEAILSDSMQQNHFEKLTVDQPVNKFAASHGDISLEHLQQTNAVHFKICFNIILPSKPNSFQWIFQ